MTDPVLHLIAGPNGAGKSTLYDEVIGPETHLEFVNADIIAADRAADDPVGGSYEAAGIAAARRSELIERRCSFATETVFSHDSKVELVEQAVARGYLVTLHVVMVPEELAVARVVNRVSVGGHSVPEDKVRERYHRLWPLVARAIQIVDNAVVYDNSKAASPLRGVATWARGRQLGHPEWPIWTPAPLRTAAFQRAP